MLVPIPEPTGDDPADDDPVDGKVAEGQQAHPPATALTARQEQVLRSALASLQIAATDPLPGEVVAAAELAASLISFDTYRKEVGA